MKKIYWFLQQLEFLGGTETATISIANELVNIYDITFIITARAIKNPPYEIDKRIKIIYLGNENNSKIDEKIAEFCRKKLYFKAFLLIIKNINFTLFTKYKYRKQIKKMTSTKDILIASSLDNYLIIPRKRYCIFHYHFNGKFFNSFNERFMSIFYRKPDKYIFLNDTILKACTKNKKSLKNISYAIENPIKIKAYYNLNFYNNSLVFVGRFAEQKNPLFLIESINELQKTFKDFHLDMYGSGKLKNEIIAKITKYNLDNFISVHEANNDIYAILKNKDLLILTSIYEGMPLVINEAASQSIPTFSTNFGESTKDCISDNSGIFVDTNNPKIFAKELENLLRDNFKLLNLKEGAYNYSKKYSVETIIEKWKIILK